MARTLPLDDLLWPDHRILVRQTWADSNSNPITSGDGWTPLAMAKAPSRLQVGGNGFRVIEYERVALPAVGTAKFGFRFGKIDGQVVGFDNDGNGGFTSQVPDLVGWEVRIQVRARNADGTFGSFRTAFWGQIILQEEQGQPGASTPAGDRIYHCVDGLYRASRWRLDRCGYSARKRDGSVFQNPGPTRGHPGYNFQRDKESRIEGNRWSSQWSTEGGLNADYHTWPGQGSGADLAAANFWTDQQAIEHALAASRPSGEPWFQMHAVTVSGVPDPYALNLFNTTSVWPVHDGDSAFDLVSKACRRERGRGLVFVDWNDDSGAPDGPLTCKLTVCNQNAFDIHWTNPVDGSSQTIPQSAYFTESTNAVDLVGDHRVLSNGYKLGDKDQYRVDALESLGEPLEVLVTLAFQDGLSGSKPNQDARSLERGWLDSEQTAFRAINTAAQRVDERWRPVYQFWRLPMSWDGFVGDGENGANIAGLSRCDYRCDDLGNIVDPGNPGSYPDGTHVDSAYLTQYTAPFLVQVLHTLPLYEQWDYSVSPPVQRGGGTQNDTPDRRQAFAFFRVTQNKYLFAHEKTDGSFAMEVRNNLIAFYEASDQGKGSRYVSDTTLSTIGLSPRVDYQNLGFTVALRLPHRVRLYSGKLPTDPLCKRRIAIEHRNVHLWLAHPGAVWDLDATTGSASTGHTPRRFAAGAKFAPVVPGKLRDDRAKLAQLHAMAWSWYGQLRRSAQWSLRDCGFLGSYQAFAGSSVPTDGSSPSSWLYPGLGQIVTTITANGQTEDVNTPVTRIHYDNVTGVTRWETDWCGLDFE